MIEEIPGHSCAGILNEKLKEKEKENGELKELLAKVNNKLEKVFKKYYPTNIKDMQTNGNQKRSTTGYDIFKKERY